MNGGKDSSKRAVHPYVSILSHHHATMSDRKYRSPNSKFQILKYFCKYLTSKAGYCMYSSLYIGKTKQCVSKNCPFVARLHDFKRMKESRAKVTEGRYLDKRINKLLRGGE